MQITLLQNINTTAGSVSDGTYAAFIALMFLGLVISCFICDADKVIREDGTKVILMKNPSWKTELIGLWETLYNEPWILLLFPMFFSSNIFYTYQNNGLNGTHFNIRTRALNNLLYWLAQILGAVVIGYCLDYSKIRRTIRAKISLGILLVVTMVVWGGGYAWQAKQVSRAVASTDEYKENELIDWEDTGSRFLGPMFLYFFYGLFDAVWQTMIYWYMGAISNSGRKAANLAGFYKVRATMTSPLKRYAKADRSLLMNRVSKVPEPLSSGALTMPRWTTTTSFMPPGVSSSCLSWSLPLSSSPGSRIPSPWKKTSSSATRLLRT
jgi:hypothetical protein